MSPEYLLGLCALVIGLGASLSNLWITIRTQKHKDSEQRLSREKTLNELMDGYMAQIREYEAQIAGLKDNIGGLIDRISCLETALAENGISTPPYGRRARDKQKTVPIET